jgi:hypothetical protein
MKNYIAAFLAFSGISMLAAPASFSADTPVFTDDVICSISQNYNFYDLAATSVVNGASSIIRSYCVSKTGCDSVNSYLTVDKTIAQNAMTALNQLAETLKADGVCRAVVDNINNVER